MKALFKRISALGLLVAILTASGVCLAAETGTTVQPPAPPPHLQLLAWDRVGSPINPVG